MPSISQRIRIRESGETVAPIELFFDLVFVFALTQVTAQMAADPTAHGLLRGVLVLALLWWAWVGYAWLGNVLEADDGFVRLAMCTAMSAMFIVAVTIPEAFDDLPGGWSGPLVVAVAYFVCRFLHLALFWVPSRDDAGLRKQLWRFMPSMLGSSAFLLIASQFKGAAQTVLWVGALAADYAGTYAGGAAGWRLRSAAHFAERHALILIVALGESIVAIGVGVGQFPISWSIVVASLTGLCLSAGLWWIYFDTTVHRGEHRLRDIDDAQRPRLARDAYSLLHFPMIAAVIWVALGLKKVLEFVGDTHHHDLSDALKPAFVVALLGGVALYLVAQVLFMLRTAHGCDWTRVATAGVLVVCIPVALVVPALVALAFTTAIVIALVMIETVQSRRVALTES